jgi:hypothetical protein
MEVMLTLNMKYDHLSEYFQCLQAESNEVQINTTKPSNLQGERRPPNPFSHACLGLKFPISTVENHQGGFIKRSSFLSTIKHHSCSKLE